ncbi:hypothetical protein ABXT06_10005 [Flavobacterium sp. UW10123]|uniref:hypothetical protein n=1 Tax=Flavobacterium sp. UW10123 TaxID=3230800 RepID=UPI003396CE20
MKLRKEIEPQFDIAEKLYSQVLKLILDYTEFCDENGDEENIEYKNLEEKLHLLTGKDMTQFNLWEWWEEDGAENLAFNISLPEPQKLEHIDKSELIEIVKRIKTFDEPKNISDFASTFYEYVIYGNGYFEKFLEKNFKNYKHNLFNRNKDKKGNYFEYSIDEIVDILW